MSSDPYTDEELGEVTRASRFLDPRSTIMRLLATIDELKEINARRMREVAKLSRANAELAEEIIDHRIAGSSTRLCYVKGCSAKATVSGKVNVAVIAQETKDIQGMTVHVCEDHAVKMGLKPEDSGYSMSARTKEGS